MPAMDPAAALRIVQSLDAELQRRRTKRDLAQDAAWAAEFDSDPVILLALRLQRDWDRRKLGESLAPLDRDALERAEEEIIQLYAIAEMVERGERYREDAKAGIRRRCPKPQVRVRSVAKLLPDSPRLEPAAPKAAERTGRKGAAPMVQVDAPEERWLRGQVFSFHPRTWQGTLRASDGVEYPLAAGALMRSGLVTLVPGMLCEFKIVAGEVEQIKAAWR